MIQATKIQALFRGSSVRQLIALARNYCEGHNDLIESLVQSEYPLYQHRYLESSHMRSEIEILDHFYDQSCMSMIQTIISNKCSRQDFVDDKILFGYTVEIKGMSPSEERHSASPSQEIRSGSNIEILNEKEDVESANGKIVLDEIAVESVQLSDSSSSRQQKPIEISNVSIDALYAEERWLTNAIRIRIQVCLLSRTMLYRVTVSLPFLSQSCSATTKRELFVTKLSVD